MEVWEDLLAGQNVFISADSLTDIAGLRYVLR